MEIRSLNTIGIRIETIQRINEVSYSKGNYLCIYVFMIKISSLLVQKTGHV